MQTIQATFTNDPTFLIQGMKGKVTKQGEISNESTEERLKKFTRF